MHAWIQEMYLYNIIYLKNKQCAYTEYILKECIVFNFGFLSFSCIHITLIYTCTACVLLIGAGIAVVVCWLGWMTNAIAV
jgi:hypothetical protein